MRDDHLATDGTSSTPNCSLERADSAARLFELALQTGRLGSWERDLLSGEFTCSGIFARHYGLQSSESVSYDELFTHVHPQDRQWVRAAIERAIAEHCGFEAEHRMLSRDGAPHWVLERGQAVYDDSGKPVRMVAVTLDVTAQKKAEEDRQLTERLFTMFMGNLAAAAWMKDLDGRYVFANDEAVRIFRTPREELYGKTDDEVFPPQIARQFKDNDRQALTQGTTLQITETLPQADGAHQSIVNKFPILGADERPMFVGGIAIDVTDRLRAEEELRENDRRKDEFLAMLAHELRNPLAAVKNAIHLAEMPNLDQKDRTWTYEIMNRQVTQLARLIDDLLDVSRITRGKIQLKREHVDLAGIVDRAVQAVRPRLDELNHTLTVTSAASGALWVIGDPARLEQVFVNLLTNAAKYTNRGGSIRVTCQRDTAHVLVRVIDTGVGIAAEMLPHIFELFTQADRSIDRSQGGLGIGLTLARKLVELHDGKIAAASQGEGHGSEFTVRLPAAAPATPEHRVQAHISSEDRARRVLVVDDNRDSATSLAKLLSLRGHQTQLAFNGTDALAAAGSFRPDVILLDIGLPGMDGYSVARAIRATAGGDAVQLIAVSGYGQPEDRRRASDAGFDHHLVKPVHHDELLKLLAEPAGSL